MTLFDQIAAYVYAKFALKYGKMYRKGSEKTAGVSAIQRLHLAQGTKVRGNKTVRYTAGDNSAWFGTPALDLTSC